EVSVSRPLVQDIVRDLQPVLRNQLRDLQHLQCPVLLIGHLGGDEVVPAPAGFVVVELGEEGVALGDEAAEPTGAGEREHGEEDEENQGGPGGAAKEAAGPAAAGGGSCRGHGAQESWPCLSCWSSIRFRVEGLRSCFPIAVISSKFHL